MRAELPFLAAGAIAIAGGVRNANARADTTTAVIATAVLIIVASATNNTPVAPLVRAVGYLCVLAAVMGFFTPTLNRKA